MLSFFTHLATENGLAEVNWGNKSMLKQNWAHLCPLPIYNYFGICTNSWLSR